MPVEAQRLGCRAVAVELNPVAALLNKVALEHAHGSGGPLPPGFSPSETGNPTFAETVVISSGMVDNQAGLDYL